jgi:hypothetical protein
MAAARPFVLRVPVDASQVRDFTPGRISVLAWNYAGCQKQQTIAFQRKGTVIVTFDFERAPETLRVALGPEDATPFELRHLQTVSADVPPSAWRSSSEVELPAFRLTPWHWWLWQHWRQSYRVTGRVVDRHGRPVAGAAVSAFDVDAWWWWTAKELVGSAVTQSDGSFAIGFTRCCGWSPAWWWSTRDWRLDAALMKKITAFMGQYPGLAAMAVDAGSPPSLEVFQSLLASMARPLPSMLSAPHPEAGKTMGPAALEQIRERLVEILPPSFPLPIWPWSHWSPWEDCGANLIFRVTRVRGDRTAVLLNEGALQARWDIPSSLDVKLISGEAIRRDIGADWTLVDYLFPHPGVYGAAFAPTPSSVVCAR